MWRNRLERGPSSENPLLYYHDASERLKRLKRLSVFFVNDTQVPNPFVSFKQEHYNYLVTWIVKY